MVNTTAEPSTFLIKVRKSASESAAIDQFCVRKGALMKTDVIVPENIKFTQNKVLLGFTNSAQKKLTTILAKNMEFILFIKLYSNQVFSKQT